MKLKPTYGEERFPSIDRFSSNMKSGAADGNSTERTNPSLNKYTSSLKTRNKKPVMSHDPRSIGMTKKAIELEKSSSVADLKTKHGSRWFMENSF